MTTIYVDNSDMRKGVPGVCILDAPRCMHRKDQGHKQPFLCLRNGDVEVIPVFGFDVLRRLARHLQSEKLIESVAWLFLEPQHHMMWLRYLWPTLKPKDLLPEWQRSTIPLQTVCDMLGVANADLFGPPPPEEVGSLPALLRLCLLGIAWQRHYVLRTHEGIFFDEEHLSSLEIVEALALVAVLDVEKVLDPICLIQIISAKHLRSSSQAHLRKVLSIDRSLCNHKRDEYDRDARLRQELGPNATKVKSLEKERIAKMWQAVLERASGVRKEEATKREEKALGEKVGKTCFGCWDPERKTEVQTLPCAHMLCSTCAKLKRCPRCQGPMQYLGPPMIEVDQKAWISAEKTKKPKRKKKRQQRQRRKRRN